MQARNIDTVVGVGRKAGNHRRVVKGRIEDQASIGMSADAHWSDDPMPGKSGAGE
jgi:hypothetical protein